MTQPATFDERARTLTHSLLKDAERIPSRLPRYGAKTLPWKAIALFAACVLVIGGAIVGASVALHRASVATPAPASHAKWKSFPLPDRGGGSAISCPNSSECVALGFGTQVYFSGNPAGGTETWKVASIEPAIPTQQDRQLTGISCPAPSLCVATDIVGNVVASTNPGGGVGAWTLSRVASDATLSGISCPHINLCIAIGGTTAKVNPVGLVITSTDPAAGSSAWNVTKVDGIRDLRSISCPSVTFCVAIDGEGNVATSTDPNGGTHAWHVAEGGATFGVVAIDCPSTQLCVGVQNSGAIVTSTDPAGGRDAWTLVVPDPSLIFMSVSCPITTFCIAGPQWDSVLVSNDPTGGLGAWKRQRVIASGVDPMWGLSCPSTRFCVGVGDEGVHVYTSTGG